jgi:hypothetical protein
MMHVRGSDSVVASGRSHARAVIVDQLHPVGTAMIERLGIGR